MTGWWVFAVVGWACTLLLYIYEHNRAARLQSAIDLSREAAQELRGLGAERWLAQRRALLGQWSVTLEAVIELGDMDPSEAARLTIESEHQTMALLDDWGYPVRVSSKLHHPPIA